MAFKTAAAEVAAIVRAEMAYQRKGQTSLAQALGCSQAAVSRRLQGHVPFDMNELAIIATFLGKTPAQLLPAEQVVA